MAKITIEELSSSLKEYLNGLGLTEDQVQGLIDKMVEENIGDISQLSTEEKGSLVGAINELFINANNGKQLIADAIGEPLDSNDTFSAMSGDINSLLSTFKTNMMNNGVTVESSDKFKALIDKIADTIVEVTLDIVVHCSSDDEQVYISYPENLDFGCIPEEVTILFETQLTIEYPNVDYTKSVFISDVSRYGINFTYNGMVSGDYNATITIKGRKDTGKGIQYASGSISKLSVGVTGNLPTKKTIPYTTLDLDFKPTILFIYVDTITGGSTDYFKETVNSMDNYSDATSCHGQYYDGSYFMHRMYISNITDNSFDLYTYTDLSESSFEVFLNNVNWYAIGVGEEDTTLRDSLASILTDEGVEVTDEDDMASLISKVDEEFTNDNNNINELNNQITDLNNELAGKVTPAGDATAADVIAGKTFINSTGQLITGTGNLTRMLTTGSQTITVSTDSPPENTFKKTVSHSFGAVPSNIIIITSNVVLTTGSTTRFTAYNLALKNGTTVIPYKTVYSSATNKYGGISITNITETTFDISVNAAYWATSDNATCTIKVTNIIYY